MNNNPLDALIDRVSGSSQSEVARQLGVSRQLVSQILAGDKAISEAVANRLGFRRVAKWERV